MVQGALLVSWKKKCVNIAYAYVQLPSYDILRTEHDKL